MPPPKKEEFIKSLLDMSKSDMQGISKYLNLNVSEKLPGVEKMFRGNDSADGE